MTTTHERGFGQDLLIPGNYLARCARVSFSQANPSHQIHMANESIAHHTAIGIFQMVRAQRSCLTHTYQLQQ
jgi:hypothetical protein